MTILILVVIIVPRCGNTITGKTMPNITYNYEKKKGEKLLTSQEAAEFLSFYGRETMANLRFKNEGPDYVYIGKQLFYKKSDVVAYKKLKAAEQKQKLEEKRARYGR